jgi:hypothetical protein
LTYRQDVLAVIDESAHAERVSAKAVLNVIGQRAYGPLLFLVMALF